MGWRLAKGQLMKKANKPKEKCKHPPTRLFAWFDYNGDLCVGCCKCGEVLKGAVKENG
jgi:hypothetical protein